MVLNMSPEEAGALTLLQEETSNTFDADVCVALPGAGGWSRYKYVT